MGLWTGVVVSGDMCDDEDQGIRDRPVSPPPSVVLKLGVETEISPVSGIREFPEGRVHPFTQRSNTRRDTFPVLSRYLRRLRFGYRTTRTPKTGPGGLDLQGTIDESVSEDNCGPEGREDPANVETPSHPE